MEVRYPEVEVQLTGRDGNAIVILGEVQKALRRGMRATGEYTPAMIDQEINAFTEEATSGDYDHLLQTCMKWVEVS